MSKAIVCLFAAFAVAGGAVFLHHGKCPFSSCCDQPAAISADETVTVSSTMSCCDSEESAACPACKAMTQISAKKAPSCCDSETAIVAAKKPSCCAGEATTKQEAFAAAFGGVIVKDSK